MNEIADLAHRLIAARDEERAARAELKIAETGLSNLRDARQGSDNELIGWRQATSGDSERRIVAAEAELARLQPLIEAAEARVAAAKERIQQARSSQASITEGQETALAVWFYRDASAEADRVSAAVTAMNIRLAQAERARASAVEVYGQAEQERNLAMDESAMSAARHRMDQAKAAVEDAEVLVANLNRAAGQIRNALATAQADAETARRNVWIARHHEIMTAMRPDLNARLTEAYVAFLAAGGNHDFPAFMRGVLLEAECPPADLAAIRDRMASDLGVPSSRPKGYPV